MDAGASLRAIVIGPGPAQERLRFYCEVMGVEPPRSAEAWHPGHAAAEDMALAERVMAGFGALSADMVRRRLGSLRVLAASQVRAAMPRAGGTELRQAKGKVDIRSQRPAHAGFFGLEVAGLTHARFDGSTSPVLQREVFLSGDAVTVLPYDPLRDRVLLIEQFRMGPLGRGDPLPWQIEAIAGRIDPGESPEDCARREAVEEARLDLAQLEKVADYYPSPGAVSEYIYSYVALCDLPDGTEGVHGAEAEGEDIRSFLLSFSDLMVAIAGGAITNAPLLLTAFWLDRERIRLRGKI